MARDGHGTTITFGTSGFAAELLSVGGISLERGSIPTTHMGTTTAHTFMPADIYDGGTLDITFEYEGGDAPPIAGAVETITIVPGGAGSISFDAFMTAVTLGPAETGGRMEGSATLKITGAVTGL